MRLKEERQKSKWTQKETAQKIGISRSYYVDIENDRTLPSFTYFLPINDANR